MNENNQGEKRGNLSSGPWGDVPRYSGASDSTDLDQILRRVRGHWGDAFQGGSGNNLFIWIFLFLVFSAWFSQSVYQVKPEERGVEFFFGRPKAEISDPGLHFVFWPIEAVELVNIEQRRDAVDSFIPSPRKGQPVAHSSSLMLSADQNIVDVDFTVLWRVSDPISFLVNVHSPRDILYRVAESAMREYVARSKAEDVRTERRHELEQAVRDQIQTILDQYEMGVVIDGVQLERADPPVDVADAFEEVQRAQQDQEKYKQEAQAYANKLLGDVRGQASKVREEARGYKARVVAEAEGEAQRFISVLTEYEKAKDVTRRRLFLETMERVFERSSKVIVDEGKAASGIVPYLPLPELSRNRSGSREMRSDDGKETNR